MYRDELAAYRERLENTRQDARRAWEDVQSQLEAMAALNQQLERREIRGLEPPEVEPLRELEPPGEGATSTDYIERAGEMDREVERLRAEAELLRKVNLVLNARVQGRQADLPLGPPPRAVPASYLIAQWLGLSPMLLVFVVAFGAPGIAVMVGALGAGGWSSLLPTLLAAIVLMVLFAFARSKTRFLAECKQAEGVTVSSTTSTSSSYKNWNLPVARGWQVTYEAYTGSGTMTTLRFVTDDGRTGSAEVKGRPYESGVVLYHPATLRAHCVSAFRCAPHPDARGAWQPGLSVPLIIRVSITALLLGAALLSPLIGLLMV